MAQKWIVENNIFKMANVGFHYELAKVEANVIGGGWFKVNLETKKLYLYSKSVDFGYCSKEQVLKSLENSLSIMSHRLHGFKVFFSQEDEFINCVKNCEYLTTINPY